MKKIFFLALFIVSASFVDAEIESLSIERTQDSFRECAEKVYPTVVAITTVQIADKKDNAYYVPKSDPFFSKFFSDTYNNGSIQLRIPDREFKKVSVASGVIVDPRGYILTNFHIVEKAEKNKVTVRLSNGKEYEGSVEGTDPRYDIAMVKIDAGDDLPAAVLGDSASVRVGDWAIAIGNPYGFAFDDAQPTMTVGVVSAVNRSLPSWIGMKRSYTNLIQTDAAINEGNSGGPLVNINGEIIGINVAIVSTSGGNQGIGFAIPSNLCQDIIKEVIEGEEIYYSWLGINVQSLNYELAGYFNYPGLDGVLVTSVVKNGPADIGGIREGDIITFFNGTPVRKISDLMKEINNSRVGEKVSLTIFRNEYEQTIDVIMGSRPRGSVTESKSGALFWRGLKVDNVTYEVARELGITDLKGVVVTEVQKNSPAEKSGIMPGEVILKINNTEIKNLDDYYSTVYDLIEWDEPILVKTLRGYFVLKGK